MLPLLLLLLLPLLLFCIPILALGVILVRNGKRRDNLLLLALGIVVIALSGSCLAFVAAMFAILFAVV